MSDDRKPTLIIYGATSYTARELLKYLETHPEALEFEFILAGRNAGRLEGVNARLSKPREVAVCDLSDAQGIKSLVAKGDVVVNLAGPFRWHNAEALISACVEAGKHYVDLCGESAWLAKDIIPKYHTLASSTGSCIVPSCGFDSIPSDLTVYQALRTLQTAHPAATLAKSTSLFKLRGTMSGGTVQSMYSIAELPSAERRSGEYDLCPDGKRPSTRPALTYTLPSPRLPKQRYASFFFMYPYNRCILRRSQYLSRQSTSDTQAEPVHGEDMEYAEGLEFGGGKLKSALISLSFVFFFGLFFGAKWFRTLAARWLPKAGEGASSEELHKGFANITNHSISNPLPSGEVVEILTTYKGKGDPGYLHTTYLLAESALALVLPPPEGTTLPPLARQGGVLTPSTALGEVLVERLRISGKATIQSEIVMSVSRKDI